MPVDPPEAWGAGVTYRRSADFREEGTGFYDRVYAAERPELFFKASAWRCVGPGRADRAAPRLGLHRGRAGDRDRARPRAAAILGFTLANDVSAWDIERDNPLYLPQSKVYNGCFAFGPVIVTPDEIADPYALVLRCRVTRGAREVFAGEASTAQLKRRFEEIVAWLLRSNEIRTGTVLSTGTGIIQPLGRRGSRQGDVVTLSCPQIGELAQPRGARLMAAPRGIERDPYQLRPEDVEDAARARCAARSRGSGRAWCSPPRSSARAS